MRGWVKVFSDTEPSTNILNFPTWLLRLGGERREYRLEDGRSHGKGIIAKLVGCDDRDQAAALVGSEIMVPRSALPETGNAEYYWADLEGLEVRNLEGVDLGRVDYLFQTGSNDVMVVVKERNRLIPFTEDAVKSVDLEHGVITVDWDREF